FGSVDAPRSAEPLGRLSGRCPVGFSTEVDRRRRGSPIFAAAVPLPLTSDSNPAVKDATPGRKRAPAVLCRMRWKKSVRRVFDIRISLSVGSLGRVASESGPRGVLLGRFFHAMRHQSSGIE